MVVSKIQEYSSVIVDDYPFAQELKEEVMPILDVLGRNDNASLTSLYADSNMSQWGLDTTQTQRLKDYLMNLLKDHFPRWKGGRTDQYELRFKDFWANVYNKGDYHGLHNHTAYKLNQEDLYCYPPVYSIVYFLKSKWYHAPLVFKDSGKKISPKEGRFIMFPAHMWHYVAEHKYKSQRISLATNIEYYVRHTFFHLDEDP